METSRQNPLTEQVTACNPACRYAEPVRGDYTDWIWCTHPRATERLKRSASDCTRFEPALAARAARTAA